jgi:hypothetical protein
MGSMYLPNIRVDTIDMGESPVANPENLMLEIDGVVYGSGYLESPGTYQRQIFPVYDAGNQHIYVKIINTATGASCPATSLSNIRVLIIG